MPFSELSMAVLFMLFLLLFVLVGIYPAWKRAMAKMPGLLKGQGDSRISASGRLESAQSPITPEGQSRAG